MSGFLCSMVGASFTVAAAAEILRSKKAIIANGNAQIDTAQSQFGGASALFDGTGDYLFSPSNSDFGFGTGDFTLEGWFRFVNFTNGPALFDLRAAGGTEVKPLIYCGADGVLYYYVNGAARITGSALSATTWYHITVSRASGSTKMFVNGTQVGSTYSDSNNYGTTVVSIGIASWNTAFNALNGHADEIRISKSARYTTNFTPSTTPFVNDDNTVLLIHANGTDATTFFEDDNGVRTQRGITAVGNAQIDTAQSKFGGASALFDGTGDHLLISGSSDWRWNTTNYTIEFWTRVNTHVNTGSNNLPAQIGSMNPNSGTAFWNFGTDDVGKITFHYYNGAVTKVAGSTNLSTGVQYHLAMVYTSSDNTIKLYVDGTQAASAVVSGTPQFSDSLALCLGQYNSVGYNGHIDEVRISNTARYTANFTPATEPFVNDSNTLLLMHMDGTDASTVFRDDNGISQRVAKHISYYGNAQIDTAQSKFGGSSLLLDGNGDYLTADTNFAIGTGDFTIECWFRTTVNASANYYIFDARSGASLAVIQNTNNINVFTGGAILGGPTISTNTWYHMALVRSSGTATFYINGTGYQAHSLTTNFAQCDFFIGCRFSQEEFWNGHLDEFRVSNIARYTANFTAPTAPFQNDANTVLLLHFNGADAATTFVDDNGGRASRGIVAIGNAQIDTAQSKFGGSSALFDGTGDYIRCLPAALFPTDNFTIEFWVRFVTVNTDRILAAGYESSASTENWAFYVSGTSKLVYYLSSVGGAWDIASGVQFSATTLTTNTWYHAALVRNGTTFTPYFDGVAGTTTTSSAAIYPTTDGFFFGGISGTAVNCYIDEVRISNTARYTANFTPSTAPFQNDSNTLLLLHMDGTDASTVFFDDNGRDTTPT